MKRFAPVAALSLAAVLALTGCGAAGESSDAAAIDAEPATGELITGDGYTYNVPEGWVQSGEEALQGVADTLVFDGEDTDDFTDNVNVLLSPAGAVTADQVESDGLAEFEQTEGAEVEVAERVVIADSESAHLSGSLSQQGVEYLMEQYYATNGDQTYVITFSFSSGVSDEDRAAVTDPILASWAWS